ncbi:GNAT family N-acetyltransferase [Glaciimonas soli]|nr:GNAT family protein [Glaciimonas soli]
MIEGSAISIRHVRKSDLIKLIPLMNNLQMRGQYLPSSITSPDLIEKNFDADQMSTDVKETLLIVDKKDNIIGSLWHFKSVPYFNAREIGYTLYALEQRGQGIVSEAVRLLSAYLFKSRMINRLEIRMDTNNIASEKVAIKCGYQKEGISRAANFVNGKNVDMFIYSLLRNEWECAQEKHQASENNN